MQESVGRGWSPSMKTLCQPWEGGAEEEVMLEPTSSAGLGSKGGSRMTRGTVVGIGEGPKDELMGGSVGSEES
nr:hypothetical protein CFP56_53002 [Quercus suber]